MLTKRIKKVMKRPNKREAIISPKIIAHTAIGVETNRSKVLACVSHGAITGPIDEAAAKRVIPNKPGIKGRVRHSLNRHPECEHLF
jgi:hypothetical protein